MRFKTIVIVFNTVIVLSFLFIFFVPLVLLGPDYFALFLSRNWIAGALFVAALAAVNGYFAANARLFGLLEAEDWPALVSYLETEVYRKGHVRAKQVRLLANAYLVTSNAKATKTLEEEVRRRRPGLVPKLAVQFGIRHLLAADSEESERFFSTLVADRRVPGRDWLRWNHAFCLCRRGQRDRARDELQALLPAVREPVLRLLVVYLLGTACGEDREARAAALRGRDELRERYPQPTWKRAVELARSNLEVIVLSKVIEDARSWLDDGAPTAAAGHAPR